ncbi:MAG: hypothetical protein PVF58_03815 [Candidatus Methanofastidiosia archaeon]
MSDEEINLWQPVHSLWIKYCGIADEYRMLRDKWLFVQERLAPALPNLGTEYKTFAMLDNCVRKLNEEFEKFGQRRNRRTNFNNSSVQGDLTDLNKIKDDFLSLSQYTGLLKLAYFQRTESMEISSVATGQPYGAERTIGNELFYVAADKVAQCYRECLDIQFVEWDGFVTFLSPVTSSFFYGAFFKPTKSFKLFHVSMSEEQKYFVGSYLHLAHEMGHACICGNELQAEADESPASEIDYIRNLALNSALQEEWGGLERCKVCPYNREKMYLDKNKSYFNEFLADLIALEVGGIFTLESFLDEYFDMLDCIYFTPRPGNSNNMTVNILPILEGILRVRGILYYLELNGRDDIFRRKIEFRIENLANRSRKIIKNAINEFSEILGLKSDIKLLQRDVCIECISSLGKSWCKYIFELDREFIRRFVLDPFEIESSTEKEIKNSLKDGIPPLHHDIRHILHVYYQLFRDFHKNNHDTKFQKASYAATIHSLIANST